MADYTSRRTLMVDTQVRPSDVTKFPIIDALLSVPREEYVTDDKREAAYIGEHIHLSADRVVLDPRTFGKMLDAADVQPDEVVLDVACGLGYSTAVLARMADFVVAVEEDSARAEEAQAILTAQGVDNAAVFDGPLNEGAAKNGPYDLVMLQGAIEAFPDALAEQVKEGGRVVAIFTEGALGVVRVGHKIDGTLNWRMAFNATAPLLNGFTKEAAFSF